MIKKSRNTYILAFMFCLIATYAQSEPNKCIDSLDFRYDDYKVSWETTCKIPSIEEYRVNRNKGIDLTSELTIHDINKNNSLNNSNQTLSEDYFKALRKLINCVEEQANDAIKEVQAKIPTEAEYQEEQSKKIKELTEMLNLYKRELDRSFFWEKEEKKAKVVFYEDYILDITEQCKAAPSITQFNAKKAIMKISENAMYKIESIKLAIAQKTEFKHPKLDELSYLYRVGDPNKIKYHYTSW